MVAEVRFKPRASDSRAELCWDMLPPKCNDTVWSLLGKTIQISRHMNWHVTLLPRTYDGDGAVFENCT